MTDYDPVLIIGGLVGLVVALVAAFGVLAITAGLVDRLVRWVYGIRPPLD